MTLPTAPPPCVVHSRPDWRERLLVHKTDLLGRQITGEVQSQRIQWALQYHALLNLSSNDPAGFVNGVSDVVELIAMKCGISPDMLSVMHERYASFKPVHIDHWLQKPTNSDNDDDNQPDPYQHEYTRIYMFLNNTVLHDSLLPSSLKEYFEGRPSSKKKLELNFKAKLSSKLCSSLGRVKKAAVRLSEHNPPALHRRSSVPQGLAAVREILYHEEAEAAIAEDWHRKEIELLDLPWRILVRIVKMAKVSLRRDFGGSENMRKWNFGAGSGDPDCSVEGMERAGRWERADFLLMRPLLYTCKRLRDMVYLSVDEIDWNRLEARQQPHLAIEAASGSVARCPFVVKLETRRWDTFFPDEDFDPLSCNVHVEPATLEKLGVSPFPVEGSPEAKTLWMDVACTAALYQFARESYSRLNYLSITYNPNEELFKRVLEELPHLKVLIIHPEFTRKNLPLKWSLSAEHLAQSCPQLRCLYGSTELTERFTGVHDAQHLTSLEGLMSITLDCHQAVQFLCIPHALKSICLKEKEGIPWQPHKVFRGLENLVMLERLRFRFQEESHDAICEALGELSFEEDDSPADMQRQIAVELNLFSHKLVLRLCRAMGGSLISLDFRGTNYALLPRIGRWMEKIPTVCTNIQKIEFPRSLYVHCDRSEVKPVMAIMANLMLAGVDVLPEALLDTQQLFPTVYSLLFPRDLYVDDVTPLTIFTSGMSSWGQTYPPLAEDVFTEFVELGEKSNFLPQRVATDYLGKKARGFKVDPSDEAHAYASVFAAPLSHFLQNFPVSEVADASAQTFPYWCCVAHGKEVCHDCKQSWRGANYFGALRLVMACRMWTTNYPEGHTDAEEERRDFEGKHVRQKKLKAKLSRKCNGPGCLKREMSAVRGGTLENRDLTMCSRCKSVFYCSRKCQKEHWKGGHKEECKPPEGSDGQLNQVD